MTTAPAHAPFAPSSMERIALCPGSYKACVGIEELPGRYAEDGTEAHATFAYCLENNFPRLDHLWNRQGSPVHSWAHRADTREEREESIQYALDRVYEILDTYDDAVMYVEKRVQFPSFITEDCWGTADVVIIVPSMKAMYVIDYKHGAGKYVSAEDNVQTGIYTAAALAGLSEGFEIADCHAVIIQPRAFSSEGPYRQDIRSATYFSGLFRDTVDGYIAAALADDAPLNPGAVQCQFCPRRANCPAREATALAAVSDTFKSVRDVTTANLPVVSQLPLDRIAFVLSAAKVLKGWINDVEQTALDYARAGKHVPGFKLVQVQPRRQWEGEPQDIAESLTLLTGLSLDEVMPRKLVGITEAEKLVVDAFKSHVGRGKKKQAAEDAVRAMADLTTKQSSGNVTLAPIDDPRPSVDIGHVFQGVAIPPPQQGNV